METGKYDSGYEHIYRFIKNTKHDDENYSFVIHSMHPLYKMFLDMINDYNDYDLLDIVGKADIISDIPPYYTTRNDINRYIDKHIIGSNKVGFILYTMALIRANITSKEVNLATIRMTPKNEIITISPSPMICLLQNKKKFILFDREYPQYDTINKHQKITTKQKEYIEINITHDLIKNGTKRQIIIENYIKSNMIKETINICPVISPETHKGQLLEEENFRSSIINNGIHTMDKIEDPYTGMLLDITDISKRNIPWNIIIARELTTNIFQKNCLQSFLRKLTSIGGKLYANEKVENIWNVQIQREIDEVLYTVDIPDTISFPINLLIPVRLPTVITIPFDNNILENENSIYIDMTNFKRMFDINKPIPMRDYADENTDKKTKRTAGKRKYVEGNKNEDIVVAKKLAYKRIQLNIIDMTILASDVRRLIKSGGIELYIRLQAAGEDERIRLYVMNNLLYDQSLSPQLSFFYSLSEGKSLGEILGKIEFRWFTEPIKYKKRHNLTLEPGYTTKEEKDRFKKNLCNTFISEYISTFQKELDDIIKERVYTISYSLKDIISYITR